MTALDDHFGPSQISSEPAKQPVRTNWPHAPEHLRPILDKWEELVGFHPDAGVVRRLWTKGANDWYEAFGLSLRLFEKSFRKLMKSCERHSDMIRPSHPGALIKTALGEMPRPASATPKFPCEDCQTGVDYPTKDNPTSCPSCGLEYEWEAT